MSEDVLQGPVRESEHRGSDDLLSAGLGLVGLAGEPVRFADPARPTAAEARRRAIQMNWRGIADLGPLGGYGRAYGAVPEVPGREFSAFARLPGARATHRVLLQAPDCFDARARCLVVAASSGSRGIYGAIALAGAFGLANGCAVVYTDKAAGTGYYDPASGTGVALDGTRAQAGEALLEFEPEDASPEDGIAVKHMHSCDHPEADWGRHVLQAARVGLAMLDRAYPDQAPFTPGNTRIIATGLSNGGGAVLQAAGLDSDDLIDGVVALEPNVHVPGRGRALYDYVTEAALWMPCALLDARFDATPMARIDGMPPAPWLARCDRLHARGRIAGRDTAARAAEALEHLHAAGWRDPVLATAASTTIFDAWRSVAAGYASAYLRAGPGSMPCGFGYRVVDATGVPAPSDAAGRATWWSDASGIPPGAGVGLVGGTDDSDDPAWSGLADLRVLWESEGDPALALHASVDALAVKLPRKELALWVIHGTEDGLIPTAFTSEPYVAWLREHGRTPRFWNVPRAQHFDAFLPLPGFGDVHVPLLPYGYAALEAMHRHLVVGDALPDPPTPRPVPRGAGMLEPAMLDLPR